MQETARGARLPSALALLTAWLGAALALAVARVPILTPDVWWHLATGRWISAHGIPRQDPFSYTLAGRSWTAHEWLADVIWARAFAAGDLGWVVGLRVGLVVLAWWVSYRLARLHASRFTTLPLLAIAAWVSQRNWLDRPQLWTYALVPLGLFLLERTRQHPRRWIWALPLVFALWVNLHGGFMLGLALLAGWCLAPLVGRGEDRAARLRQRLPLLLASGVATLANPYGLRGALYPLGYVRAGLRHTIQEERAGTLDSGFAWVHLGLVVTTLVVLLVRRRRVPLEHGLVVAMLAWLSLPRLAGVALPFAAERHAPLFLHACVPFLAWWLDDAWGARWHRFEARSWMRTRTAAAWVATIVVVGFAAWQVWRAWPRPARPGDWMLPGRFPVAAADWIAPQALPSRLLNPYRWGGYLAFRLHPAHAVWIDSRGDLYGAERLREDEILHRFTAANAAAAEQLIARDDPDVIVWPLLSLDFGPLRVHPFTRWILQRPEWRLVFYDRPDASRPRAPWATTAVFLRVDRRNAASLERLPAIALPPGLPP